MSTTPVPDETLVFEGGAIKALDDSGRVGGYLVLFGSPDLTDATTDRDYFTPETDFGLDTATKSRLYYHHGLTKKLGNRVLGIGSMKIDDAGVWLESQLELRDKYEQKIYEAIKQGKMGLSSGSALHLVRKERQDNGAHKITSWPLGLDATITPTPAEPRTLALPIKSLPDADADEAIKLMAEGDDASGGATADADDGKAIKPGHAVKWSGYGAMKKGQGTVVSVHDSGNVPGTENHVEASKDAPAAKVHLRERLPEGGYRDTGRHQAHPVAKLRHDMAATKGLIMGDVGEAMTFAVLGRLNDLFMNCFWRYIGVDIYTNEQKLAAIGDAFDEYKDSALRLIEFLLRDENPEENRDQAAKSLLDQSSGRLHTGLTLDCHSDSVLTAVKGLSDRLGEIAEMRAGQGRAPLSRDRALALKALIDTLNSLHVRAESATKGSPPSPTDLTQLYADLLRIEAREAGFLA